MTEYAAAAGLPSKGQHAAQGACSWGVLSYICVQNRAMLMQGLLCLTRKVIPVHCMHLDISRCCTQCRQDGSVCTCRA